MKVVAPNTGESLSLREDEAGEMLKRDPVGLLARTPLASKVKELTGAKQFDALKREEAETRVRTFRLKVGQYVWACMMLRQGEVTPAAGESMGKETLADIARVRGVLEKEILDAVRTFGPALSRESARLTDFHETVRYDPAQESNPISFANFNHLQHLLQDMRRRGNAVGAYVDALAALPVSAHLPGIRTLGRSLRDDRTKTSEAKLLRGLKANWKSNEVRMAYARARHMEYIRDIAAGRSVLEGPSTIVTLNRIHAELYGNEAYKVSGPALVGPPGWGKTSLLQDYFRAFGVEPLSADIDPGQSSFTLMANPTLGLETDVESKRRLIGVIESLSAEDLKTLLAQHPSLFAIAGLDARNVPDIATPDGLKAVKDALRGPLQTAFNRDLATIFEGQAKKGYTYGLILKGLESGRPVILNEFPELQEWSFIHGLLTAVPASDAEAAPKPSDRPKEGEAVRMPKGWFFNTITGEWMRVGERFRIGFTGNIGVEYGNTGAPLALISRLGSSLIHVGGTAVQERDGSEDDRKTLRHLAPKSIDQEMAETVVWPHLSSRESGEFLLDDVTAYRLHFLVTGVFPKMRAHLEKTYSGKHFPLSHRVLIDMCKCMNPELNRSPCDLDEALMRVLVRPTHGLRYKSLEYVVAMLMGTGYLGTHKDELEQLIPGLGAAQFQKMIQDLKDPFDADKYTQEQDRFENACTVCSVKRCPCHGQETQEYMRYLERTAVLAKVGLDPHLVQQLIDWQQELAQREEWPMFLESYFGSKDEDANMVLGRGDREKISAYVIALMEAGSLDPDTMHVVALSIKKMFLKKTDVVDAWKRSGKAHWEKQILDAVEPVRKTTETAKQYAAWKNAEGNVRKGLAFLAAYYEAFSGERMRPEIQAALNDVICVHGGAQELWIASRLPLATTPVDAALKEQCAKRREDLRKGIEECKTLMFGTPSAAQTSARHGGGKKKVPAAIMQMPDFEQQYPQILQGLVKMRQLVDLGVADMDDVKDILTYAESQLNTTTARGRVPVAKMPYIRILRELSAIRKEAFDIDKAMAHFLAAEMPLPPVRHY